MALDRKPTLPNLPILSVSWDEKTKDVNVFRAADEFPNWEFVVMVLNGALEKAKFMANMARMEQIQANQMRAMQDEAIKRQLGKARQ